MFSKILKYPKVVIIAFIGLAIISAYLAVNRVGFNFDFEQFFPSKDKDLDFYNEYKKHFDVEDNFLLIGLKNTEGVFQEDFLHDVDRLTQSFRAIRLKRGELESEICGEEKNELIPLLSVHSLLDIEFPLKNPFTGFVNIPAIHLDQPELYERDKEKIMQDERLLNTLISEDAKSLVISMRICKELSSSSSSALLKEIYEILDEFHFEEYHIVGKDNFKAEIIRIQSNEFLFSCLSSAILVLLTMILVFRRYWGINIAMFSILICMTLFAGVLGLLGAELDTLALLYPIIMIIVATSDVIHLMTTYIAELGKGKNKREAIQTTIKSIGTSVFLTSCTTAVGFLSLLTSRLTPIRSFGIYAAIGVMLAYISVVLFTSSLLLLFGRDKVAYIKKREHSNWAKWMLWLNRQTIVKKGGIISVFFILFIVTLIGISQISTNTYIENLLPKNTRVTKDFKFFEQEFGGFRPLDFAILVKGGHTTKDLKVIQEIERLEQHVRQSPVIKSVNSIVGYYKSLNKAYNGNKMSAYKLPDKEKKFKKYQKQIKRLVNYSSQGKLDSKEHKIARITTRIPDVGSDSLKMLIQDQLQWVEKHLDTNLVSVQVTGTSVLLDKNTVYIRDSLLKGIFLAILIISLVLALIYRSAKIIIAGLIPNVFPVLVAGAILGFSGIPLDGNVAICFTIIFGIAVDDTIHMLGKFKQLKNRGYSTDDAIENMLIDTGRAICITTIILFFGFFVLLFSSNPPAITIGLLISFTLIFALVCDLLIIPILLRYLFCEDSKDV